MNKILFDFSRVILFPVDESYQGSLNEMHKELSGTVDYRFLDHYKFNEQLLEYIKENINPNDCYIFTSDAIQDSPESKERIKGLFGRIFSAKVMNISKKSTEAYIKISEALGCNPTDIIYIDDNNENLVYAKKAGLGTILYDNNNQLLERLRELAL